MDYYVINSARSALMSPVITAANLF
jgi:hypothetical protein